MKNKIKILSALFFIVIGLSSCNLFANLDNLPEGKLIQSSCSPEGNYQINAYLVSGNATTDFSIRCEVLEVSSGYVRNIYWQYHCEKADIVWIDEVTVKINENILNVIQDSYDWRTQ